MRRKNIKKINIQPKSKIRQYPRITIGQDRKSTIVDPKGRITSRNFSRKPLQDQISPPIKFLTTEFSQSKNDVCFVVGGGPSLNGFDFTQLNGFDTIAVNKAVEYIPHPTYFITTDYSYFIKASLPIERIKQKTQHTYFVANMSHDYMAYQNNTVVDTRRNFVYSDLHHYSGIIESHNTEDFGLTLSEFSNGNNSGHCGIQLALLLGYKKIYLLGFDLNADGQTHFHQSYRDIDQKSFKNRVKNYGITLNNALANYKGSQEIINLSNSSILTTSPYVKTESFNDILVERGIKLSTPTPDNSDLSNLMIVGYYTVNTPYEEEAKNLLESLNRLGINHDISGVKTLGNWQAFRWRKNECLSGTIYMENNERTKRICELWRDINVKEGNESNRMEQWNLDTVINKMKAEDPSFTYKNLPPEYTMIFDSMRGMYPNITPVIEHFQASRRFKKDVNEN